MIILTNLSFAPCFISLIASLTVLYSLILHEGCFSLPPPQKNTDRPTLLDGRIINKKIIIKSLSSLLLLFSFYSAACCLLPLLFSVIFLLFFR